MIYEKIKELCRINGITITQLEKICGLSQNSIKKWDTRNSLPNGETTLKLARYFNVSTDFLLGRIDEQTTAPAPQLTELQNEFAELTPMQQSYIRNIIQQLKIKQNTDMIEI